MIFAASISSLRQSTASRRWVKLSRASMTPGNLFKPFSIFRMQPAHDTPSTASVICDAPASPGSTNNDRSRVSAIATYFYSRRLFQNDAILRTEQPLVLARQLDDQIPLAGGKVGVANKVAGSGLTNRDGGIETPIGRPRELRAGGHAAHRRAGSVMRGNVDQCRSIGRAGYLRVHLPMLSILRLGHGDVAFEHLPGVIGARGFHAAERGDH